MRYCKKCVQPDTRPNIVFDKKGVCLACRFAKVNGKVDWQARREELEEIAGFCRNTNVSGYDCIIGVSGGKDSTRQALFVRDELGLKPLLVSCTYPPEQLTERGAHNLSNLIALGFDCISVSPDPKVWKKLMLQGFLKYGNWCKSTEMAIYASAPKVAIAYHIPVIFLGENEAIAFGSTDVGSLTGNANGVKYLHTLDGGNPDKLLTKEIKEQDVFWYRYPSDEEMEWAKLKVIFLGYYIKDFTSYKNAEFAVRHGLEIRHDPPQDIGDLYGVSALDDDYVVVNQMLKHLKFGFAKVTDQLAEMVRFGQIDRKKAIGLVKKYDGKCANRFIKRFCKYLGISQRRFWEVAESYRNKNIWEKDEKEGYRIKFSLD